MIITGIVGTTVNINCQTGCPTCGCSNPSCPNKNYYFYSAPEKSFDIPEMKKIERPWVKMKRRPWERK